MKTTNNTPTGASTNPKNLDLNKNAPTGASTNLKNFDLNKNLTMNLI